MVSTSSGNYPDSDYNDSDNESNNDDNQGATVSVSSPHEAYLINLWQIGENPLHSCQEISAVASFHYRLFRKALGSKSSSSTASRSLNRRIRKVHHHDLEGSLSRRRCHQKNQTCRPTKNLPPPSLRCVEGEKWMPLVAKNASWFHLSGAKHFTHKTNRSIALCGLLKLQFVHGDHSFACRHECRTC